jgi:aldehyde dehydrogenase
LVVATGRLTRAICAHGYVEIFVVDARSQGYIPIDRCTQAEGIRMTDFVAPGQPGSKATYLARYDHWINGEFVKPASGKYFENVSPVTGKVFCEVARGNAADVEKALDSAHAAARAWAKTSVTERSNILLKIADRMEANLEAIAVAETWENGKPIRETLAADIPLAIDHFRYFAGAIRAQEGTIGEIDDDTVAYHFHEPLGVVAQIIPWNFPILMATWKIAPALAAGNCVILKPAEQTPVSIHFWMDLVKDLLPPGVLNIVNGFGVEVGKPLASSPRVAKVAFTGETTTGRLIMQYASENIIPVTLELGGKSPNIFFNDVAAANDAFYDKALEGITMFALNQGEVCTCPSRALIETGIYDKFLADATARTKAIVQGHPLDLSTMIGAQASNDQLEKILSYIEIGKQEGAKIITGGARAELGGELADGYYFTPTIFEGKNSMRIFQEEIFGPVLAVTKFDGFDEAMKIANDTLYGLGSGVWTRDMNTAYRAGREIQAGRVWTNCYHAYPAHAAFGGYKASGIGRETHRMMLDHYQQTKNLLVSYSVNKLGFF